MAMAMMGKAALAAVGLAVATGFAGAAQADGVVNVYSARHYDTDDQIFAAFEDATGIEVNVLEADSDVLIARMVQEQEFSPADVLLTVDAGRLWRAEQAGVLQPVSSDTLQTLVPEHLRHPDGLWYGVSKRARVIVYNREDGAPEGVDEYADLADPALGQGVCIRSSSNIYNLSLMASLIARVGEDAAQDWAEGVVANFARPPQGNDTAQIRAVAAGACRLAVANSYYIARLLGSENPSDVAIGEAVGIVYPNQGGTGVHVNISGAGVAKHAPNQGNAVAFLEFLLTAEAQALLAEGNNEYPVVEGVTITAALATLGDFEEDRLNASALGENQQAAVQVYDRAGWR